MKEACWGSLLILGTTIGKRDHKVWMEVEISMSRENKLRSISTGGEKLS